MKFILLVSGVVGPALWRRVFRVIRQLRLAGLTVVSTVRRPAGVELAAISSMQAARQTAGGRRE